MRGQMQQVARIEHCVRARWPWRALTAFPARQLAQDAGAAARRPINGGDTAWMLISTALVLLMTPALAFFYGGLVRSKNALNTMMMSFISLGFVGVLWAVVGYSLAFTPGNDWVGDTSHVVPARRRPRADSHGTDSRTCCSCASRARSASSRRR